MALYESFTGLQEGFWRMIYGTPNSDSNFDNFNQEEVLKVQLEEAKEKILCLEREIKDKEGLIDQLNSDIFEQLKKIETLTMENEKLHDLISSA